MTGYRKELYFFLLILVNYVFADAILQAWECTSSPNIIHYLAKVCLWLAPANLVCSLFTSFFLTIILVSKQEKNQKQNWLDLAKSKRNKTVESTMRGKVQ
jgi:hypothetical protein